MAKPKSNRKNSIQRKKPEVPVVDDGQHKPTAMVRSSQYSGPVPPPEMLAGYESILPGAADRILTMAENNSQHHRKMESNLLVADVEADKRRHREILQGQLLGGFATLLAFGLSGLALYLDCPTVASVIGGGTVVSLVTVFVKGRSSGKVAKKVNKEE